MYITIGNIKSEKRIDLFYLIKNFDLSKEVAVVSLFSDNIPYEFMEARDMKLDQKRNMLVTAITYMRRELIDFVEGKI